MLNAYTWSRESLKWACKYLWFLIFYTSTCVTNRRTTKFAPRSYKRTCICKSLDPIISGIGNIDVTVIKIYRNSGWTVKLPDSCALETPFSNECAIALKLLDTIIKKFNFLHESLSANHLSNLFNEILSPTKYLYSRVSPIGYINIGSRIIHSYPIWFLKLSFL